MIGENPDDILGVLYLKDVVAHALGAGDGPMSVRARDQFVPASTMPVSS